MNIQQLRRFVELADRGSFTKAAERTNLTQPALSRSILQLEAELGMKLFDRIGRRNELTAFGRTLLDHARQVLFEAEELERVAKLQKAGKAGLVRISLGSTPSALLAVPLLALAAEPASELRIAVTRGNIAQQVAALRDRMLDMVVLEVNSLSPTPDLAIEMLDPVPVGFVCRPGHPLATGRTLGFGDLLAWPIGSSLISDPQARTLVMTYGPKAHPDKSLKFRSEDVAALLEVVRTSDAIYVGTLAAARSAMDLGVLVQLPVEPPSPPSRFAIVSLAGRSEPPAFHMVRAFIRERMKP